MAAGKTTAAAQDAWIVFEDEAGQGLRPPKARTWSRRGHTPVVRVTGRGSGRVSMAGLVAVKAGHRPHLFYRVHRYHRRKGERKGFAEADYAQLLRSAHHQLGGARLVVVWDNINTHTSAAMRTFLDAHTDWLTVYQLPAYAPELNPAEGVWSNVKHYLGNFAAHGVDHLAETVKTLLKRIQYRPDLIDGFLASTGLRIGPDPP